MPNRKTETATFRFDKKLLENLKEISAQENVSLNVVVSQILESYLHWQLTAPDAGWVVMIKPFLISLINEVEDEKIVKLATESSKSAAKDIALIMHGRYEKDVWIETIHQRAKRSGFKFLKYEKDKKTEYILQHDMGLKWSYYFMAFYENLFHELNIPITFDYTAKTITMFLDDN